MADSQDDDEVEAEAASARWNATDTAAYLAEMTAELMRLARGADLPVLAYLLDMARLEATMAVTRLADEQARGRRAAS